MTPDELVRIALTHPTNRAILQRLPALDIPDAWLVSGCIFQTVWNHRTGRPLDHGIRDHDVFYFDPDTSHEAEDTVIRRCEAAFADLDAIVEVRNQARVHLWYPAKFGTPYPPLRSACEGIDRFLATACMVGIQARPDGSHTVYAPAGLDDLVGMRLRPNAAPNVSAAPYLAKVRRWQALWPELTAEPF